MYERPKCWICGKKMVAKDKRIAFEYNYTEDKYTLDIHFECSNKNCRALDKHLEYGPTILKLPAIVKNEMVTITVDEEHLGTELSKIVRGIARKEQEKYETRWKWTHSDD